MQEQLKFTPLRSKHIELGAKMTPFGGWDMPLYYTNIIDEHLTVRGKAGIFDLSHMGEFVVKGPNAEQFIQNVITNDAKKLSDGKIIYSPICYENGGVIDDLLVYRFTAGHFMLVVNAANIEKDLQWLKQHLIEGAEISDISAQTALIAVQGRLSEAVLTGIFNASLNKIDYYSFISLLWNGMPAVISRTGYTGDDGFEIFVDNESAVTLWDEIFKRGQMHGLKPIGLGARDTLRLEAAMPLYGMDMDAATNPLEAGLDWAVGWQKPAFIGMDSLLNFKSKPLNKKLFCFEMLDSSIPRHNCEIFYKGVQTGVVTSGTMSPLFKKGIGMCYVKPEGITAGSAIEINIRGKLHPAVIVKKPFYSNVKKRSERAKSVC